MKSPADIEADATQDAPVGNRPLRSVLAEVGALTPARAVAVVTQIATALDAAAGERSVRRDVVDPANIVLSADDEAYLTDLGADAGAATDGLAYLAPERLTRNAPVSAATDVYALTCVLYECLTGLPPYPVTEDLPALIAAHTSAPIPSPSQQSAAAGSPIPAGLDEVVARGLAKDPDERYASAGELAAAAERALSVPEPEPEEDDEGSPDDADVAEPDPDDETVAPGADDKPQRRWRFARWPRRDGRKERTPAPPGRRRRWVAAVVLAVVLGGAGFEGWLLYAQHQKDVAAEQALDAAKKFILALSDIDPNAVDKNFNEVVDGATGDLKEHFAAISAGLRQAMIENKAEAHGTVVDAAVVSASKDKVEVMLFIDQAVRNVNLPETVFDRSRLTITMVKVDGRWLASEIDHFELP